MGDSTAMTIDFLRARLLSERSVSKRASQRADELAKRVEELEQELKLVSIQRKKAEKATADLLGILKNNGISDISEAFDSSSERGSACESKMVNSYVKEENSVDSKVRRSESEEVSEPGRSLSWKGRNGEKNDLATGRKNNFAHTSNSSSPKLCPGRSCRKIRHSETRSQSIDSQSSFMKDDPLENEVSITSENCATVACGEQEILGASERQEETALVEGHCLENGESSTTSNVDITRHDNNGDIEKALEDQAKLIDQYEAMENAQREWEEKFTETNCSRRDFCDRSSHSDVTEERDDIKEQASGGPTETTTSQVPEVKTNEVDDITASLGDITCSIASSSPTQEFAFPVTNGNRNQEIPGSDNTSHVFSPNSCFTGRKKEDSRSQSPNDQYALVPHYKNSDLSSVLEGLKMAKRSLKQQITALPSLESGYTERYVGPTVHALKTSNQVDVPIGYTGLFRLPTGYSDEETKIKSHSSDTELNLQNYSPNVDMGSRFYADDPHLVSGTRLPAHFPALPPTNFSYADMIPRMPSNEGFPPSFSSMSSPAHRMLNDDHLTPNMYR